MFLGLSITLLSTFFGQRSATAIYPDIMGCEHGCLVAASGWPLVFVRDYTGMSVINTADIMEVWLAADQLDWIPFLLNVLFWSALCLAALLQTIGNAPTIGLTDARSIEMTEPRKTPRNNMAMRLGVLVVVLVAAWFVIFR